MLSLSSYKDDERYNSLAIEELLKNFAEAINLNGGIKRKDLLQLNNQFIDKKDFFSYEQAKNLIDLYSHAASVNEYFIYHNFLPFVLDHQVHIPLKTQINFSHFSAKHNIYNQKFCEGLVTKFINDQNNYLSIEELVDLQWSLDKNKFYDLNFFNHWQNKILPRITQLDCANLSKSILAVAKNNYYSPEILKAFLKQTNHNFFEQTNQNKLFNRELINSIYGLSILITNNDRKDFQLNLANLIKHIDFDNCENISEQRQVTAAFYSLATDLRLGLTSIASKIFSWENKLKQDHDYTISPSQSMITEYLKKYDPNLEQEKWFTPLATTIDIYLPSIKYYVEVDGRQHFYNNHHNIYLATSTFKTKIIERENNIIRINNLNFSDYHDIIDKKQKTK